jgi:putative transcriptional regulator
MRAREALDERSLSDQFLIAMPAMTDPNFAHTVTYLCDHGPEGALGIVINRPLGLTLGEVLEQLELEVRDPQTAAQQVYFGGPVLPQRGFVLHEPGQRYGSTLCVNERICVTTSRDILVAIAEGHGPKRSLVALGYAGWGAGQLEDEIGDNAWLSAPGDARLVFELAPERRWDAAARSIGVDPARLSGVAGRA